MGALRNTPRTCLTAFLAQTCDFDSVLYTRNERDNIKSITYPFAMIPDAMHDPQ